MEIALILLGRWIGTRYSAQVSKYFDAEEASNVGRIPDQRGGDA